MAICNSLLVQIAEIVQDMINREYQMKNDASLHDLHHRRRWEYQPPVFDKDGNNLGSYQGHQDYYDGLQEDLEKLMKAFDEDKDCNDFDINFFGFAGDWGLARVYVKKKHPEKPDRVVRQEQLLEHAEALGGFLLDGVLLVPRYIDATAFITLSLIAGALGVELKKGY